MNIAYNGHFLKEGLIASGHNAISISASADGNINDIIGGLSPNIDLVLLELYGNNISLKGLAECEYPLAAYCVDSPINEFWLKYACRLFDYVFVDQKSSVNNFTKFNINSLMLPLCVQNNYFVERQRNKEYDISFVGTINSFRIKRSNIINLLQKHFKLNIVNNVSLLESQNIFSESKIVLNENIFNGLTLRVFQGLAANSIVYTEKSSIADNNFFVDGQDLVCYDQGNIISKLNDLVTSYNKFKNIAEYGRNKCFQFHTSEHRFQEVLAAIAENKSKNKRLSLENRKWHELMARYLKILRFGGTLKNMAIREFINISENDPQHSGEALLELGNIYARSGKFQNAEKYYRKSADVRAGYAPWLKLGLLHLANGRISSAKDAMRRAGKLCGSPQAINSDYDNLNDEELLLFMAAQILFCQGHDFEPGFMKDFDDPVPDAAFDAARLAYAKNRSPVILEFMVNCLLPYGLAGEILDLLLLAIRNGQMSNAQIVGTAEIAAQYYDLETADTILRALKRGNSRRTEK